MDFKNEINFSLAKFALGEALGYFDLEDESDNKFVTFAVKAYLQGIKAESPMKEILMKLSSNNFDSDGLLNPDMVLSDSEKAYLLRFEGNQHIVEENNYDFQTKPKRGF